MARESTQKKLSRVRPPRVQITYDVEIGDAIESLIVNKELKRDLIKKGKMNAERYRPANFAAQLKELYNSVLNEG